jgi:hypothetical protein
MAMKPPYVRAYGAYMISDKWEVTATAGWLSFDYEDYEGAYLFLTVFTEYRFTKGFGMGLSYQIAEIDIIEDNGTGKKDFEIDFLGPSVYLTYGF